MPFDSTEIFKFPKLETDSWYWFSNKKNHCYIYAVSLSVATQYIEFKKLKRMFILSMYAKTER